MVYTLYYNDKRQYIMSSQGAQYKLVIVRNPHEYPEEHSAKEWTHIGSKIRNSNLRLCRGSVSTGFFHDDTVENTSVIFLLYYITPLGQHRSNRTSSILIGFSLTNDLRVEREDSNIEEDTLYIDVICVNSNIVRHPPPGGIRGAGIFLMSQIVAYAKMQLRTPHGHIINGEDSPFKILKLSALPYVISFYRHLGFRHVHDCRDLQRDSRADHPGKWREKNVAIRTLALQCAHLRFKTDTELDYAMRIELAKRQQILAHGKQAQREKIDYFRQNLNEYFRPTGIKFVITDTRHLAESPETTTTSIVALGPDTDSINEPVTRLLHADNSAMFRLLNELRRNKLSVELENEDTPAQNTRHMHYKDSDGDIEFHSLDEGFTMRKCLEMPLMKSNTKSKKKSHRKKKSTRKKSPSKKSHRGGKQKWAGWAKLAPKRGTQRNKMQKKCGNTCFLGPDKSFPICEKNTCKINIKGVWSAYLRARQQESISKNKTQKRRYAQIANKSRKMLL